MVATIKYSWNKGGSRVPNVLHQMRIRHPVSSLHYDASPSLQSLTPQSVIFKSALSASPWNI